MLRYQPRKSVAQNPKVSYSWQHLPQDMAHLIYQPFLIEDKYLQRSEKGNARKHLGEVGGVVVSDSDGSVKLARSTSMNSGSSRSKADSYSSSSASVSSIASGIVRSSTGSGGFVKTSKKGKVHSSLVVGIF